MEMLAIESVQNEHRKEIEFKTWQANILIYVVSEE
jgi:hypothetical protein